LRGLLKGKSGLRETVLITVWCWRGFSTGLGEESAIADRHSSQIARARLNALRNYPPDLWDETAVADYNSILGALQAAEPDKDFSSFKVPTGELAPRVTGFTRGTRRAPGRTFYSSKLYCDSGRMLRRVESVAGYLAAVDDPTPDQLILAGIEAPLAAPHPGWFRRSTAATGKFFLTLLQSVAPGLVNAWLKRHGLE
jgi:hypothetical protein